MANAGHTAVDSDGAKFIAKAVPSCSALNKWRDDYDPYIFLGSTCAFNIDRLLEEIAECGIEEQVFVHERAGVITEAHRQAETDLKTGTKHLASTMQGCGTFLADKIMRRKELKLARDYEKLTAFMATKMAEKLNINHLKGKAVPIVLDRLMRSHGWTILHEGSQGFSLDINHGSHYPQCTSRCTTATQNLTDMGLPVQAMGDVYVVIRPAPIRVGNVIEAGKTVGYSGDCYDGQEELTWAQVAAAAGAPPEVTKGELTTVTKRLRRVFTFSSQQLEEAVTANGATKLALNFANYIDWSCFGTNDYDALPQKVIDFIHKCEDVAQIPVTVVGTGPQNDHVCFIK
jgi:adenylosuccinate synthase